MSTPTTIHHFIGGKPYPSKSTEWRDVTNPATQEVVARVPFATREEVELAVSNAHEAFQTWRSTSLVAAVGHARAQSTAAAHRRIFCPHCIARACSPHQPLLDRPVLAHPRVVARRA